MIKNILLAVFVAIMATGCTISGPKVKVEPPKVKIEGVEVEVEGDHDHPHDNGHCPPGQHKKGRC
jgi:hypothetical protein